MWECACGCKGIAASLTYCPMCSKEREMPTSVAGAAPANANAAPGETGYVAPEGTADAQEPVASQELADDTPPVVVPSVPEVQAARQPPEGQVPPPDPLSELEAAAASLKRPTAQEG